MSCRTPRGLCGFVLTEVLAVLTDMDLKYLTRLMGYRIITFLKPRKIIGEEYGSVHIPVN
jgi:hypothetical protein